MSRTLDALKALAVKLTTAANKAAVPGDTVDEVIDYISKNAVVSTAGLVLKDTAGNVYDVTVSTAGALTATKRTS